MYQFIIFHLNMFTCLSILSIQIQTENIKKRLGYANKIKSKFAIIIGEEEANQSAALVKNLDTGKQIKIKFNELSKYLKKILQLK